MQGELAAVGKKKTDAEHHLEAATREITQLRQQVFFPLLLGFKNLICLI